MGIRKVALGWIERSRSAAKNIKIYMNMYKQLLNAVRNQ